MKVGDKLHFKKFTWVTVSIKEGIFGQLEIKYKVRRKYFKGILSLSYTRCTYSISQIRWDFLKEQLQLNPNYHYTQSFWSNHKRTYERKNKQGAN